MRSDTADLRIGVLGCANIAKKNVIAILQTQSGSCCITAIASRSIEKAEAFLQEIVIPRSTTTNAADAILILGGSSAYDDIIASSAVDALYIPLPTALHREWVTKALSAGKHVLLEKPVATSLTEYQEMLQTAKFHNKFLMDGTMFVHHPRTQHFVQAVHNNNDVGRLTRIEAGFSFCGNDDFLQHNIRVKKDADALGCLGDLAWYVVRIALLVVVGTSKEKNNMNSYENVAISAQVTDYQLNDEGVPVDATCLVRFRNNVVLSFHCGFGSHFRQHVHIVGTKGGLMMDDFVLPKSHPLKYQNYSMNLTQYDLITEHACQHVIVGENNDSEDVQEVLMWNTFSRLAKAVDANGGWDNNNCEDDSIRAALEQSHISAANQKILDALMASIRKGSAKIEVL